MLLTFVRGVVVGVKRNEPEKVSIAVGDRADLLAQSEGTHRRAARPFQVADYLPPVAGVPIQTVPIEFAQTAKGRDDLLQLRRRESEEDVLERRAVQVESNPPTCGHGDARHAW